MSSLCRYLCSILSALVLFGYGGEPAQAAPRPNLVLIMMDDLDAASVQQMPQTLALIADRGVTFDRAFATATLCFPSRATFFSGRYPHSTGMRNGGHKKYHQQHLDIESLGPWLQRAGYLTGFFGKYVNDYPRGAADTFVPPGWSRWVGATFEQFYNQYDYGMNEDGRLVAYGHTAADYFTDVLSRKSIEFLDTAKATVPAKPFAMIVSPSAPHVPLIIAQRDKLLFPDAIVPRTPGFGEAVVRDKPPFNRKTMSQAKKDSIDNAYRKRLRMLAAADDLVAAVVSALETRGLLAQTYVMVTSDHGYHMGQHNLQPDKMQAYEEDIRIPLMVRGPGVPAGVHLPHVVINNDFAPTLVALGGGSVPANVDGRSFAALLKSSPPDPATWRKSFLITRLPGGLPPPPPVNYPPPTREYGCVIGTPSSILPEYWAVRTSQYTYIEYANGDRELYDDVADPGQLVNKYCFAPPALLDALSSLLTSLKTCSGATCTTAEDQDVSPM